MENNFVVMAGLVLFWIVMLVMHPVATLVITATVALIGGIFMTSGDGDGGTGSRWGSGSGWL